MKEINKIRIAAIIVTYNRKQLLIECVERLVNQTYPPDSIFIIDNASTDGTMELLGEKGFVSRAPVSNKGCYESLTSIPSKISEDKQIDVHYIRMSTNTGGSGGFCEGVKRGYEAGFDWLWLMDDDAEPDDVALLELTRHLNYRNVSALASVVCSKKGISFGHRGLINYNNFFPLLQEPLSTSSYNDTLVEIDIASFVGILINCHVVSSVGYPRKDFFIYHDDVEYCLRLRERGKIFLVTKSRIFHKEEWAKVRRTINIFGFKSLRYPYTPLFYFKRRNVIWTVRKYINNGGLFYYRLTLSLIRDIICAILFDDCKLRRMRLIALAYWHGLTSSFPQDSSKIKVQEILRL